MFTTIATRTNHRGTARTEANQRINALIEKVNEGFARGNIDAKASKVNFEGVIVIQGNLTSAAIERIQAFLASRIVDVKFYGANDDPDASHDLLHAEGQVIFSGTLSECNRQLRQMGAEADEYIVSARTVEVM